MHIFFFLLFVIPLATAQELSVSSGAVPVGDGYDYLVTNNEPVPVSVKLDLELKNLKADVNSKQIFIVPPFAQEYKILELRMVKRDSYGYNASASYALGDQRTPSYDQQFKYHLPYARNASWRVSQGYNGNSTHRGKFAIDFTMPVGTPVHAARGGTVIQVTQENSIGCAAPKCLEYANYIKIIHDDGSIAEYTHLQVNGAVVKKGDRVGIDQHIGYSGNTGWTTGPHLHFTVYVPRFGRSSVTVPVTFVVENSLLADALLENRRYRKP